ncbi:hypothetical protein M407DRAFT_117164 [Tulasnella calospora MUT 4182]|uniref:Uncharacterized protein n=1 Tax=Tulasnella calospora MUT 4182 TaxID=1051891 RepID=A0A0C3LMI4_9AGAM|nr:hypothetical protein M407DRAFT_117164 [Tulasnella calospora MUT 4182]
MSDTTEEIRLPDIVFNGADGKECEAFVVAIQEFAFSKGSDEDHQWMLRFAKTRLRGKALRWYAKLDQSIRKDWDLFVQALFDQYPLVEAPDDGAIATPVWSTTTFSPSLSTITLPANQELNPNSTTQSPPLHPAIRKPQLGRECSFSPHLSGEHTYPARPYDASSQEQQIGVLRIVTAGGTRFPQYVWWDYTVEEMHGYNIYCYYEPPKMTTMNHHEALIVSFLPSSAPHQIGCPNSRADLRTLAIDYGCGPSVEYFTLHGCSKIASLISPALRDDGFVSKVWNILADGTLQASISSFTNKPNDQGGYDMTKFTTTEVHVDTSGAIIRFVKPGALLNRTSPKATLFTHSFGRASCLNHFDQVHLRDLLREGSGAAFVQCAM